MTEKLLICDEWEFSKQPFGTEYSEDFCWEKIDIPHDWLIYDAKNLYETSTGWYRRKYFYQKSDEKIFIRFDGVYMDSSVYVNGKKAGEWKYGYSTFEFDITELLCEGENLITVRVNYQSPNSRWYSGAGIFRKVQIIKRPPVHIAADGVYINAVKSKGCPENWTVTTSVEISKALEDGKLVQRIYNEDGEVVKYETVFNSQNPTSSVEVSGVKLWDINSPCLYSLETTVFDGDREIDRSVVTFGFRTIEFTADKGFFLNGRHVKLHGCCEHHDLGALGAAFNKSVMAARLEKLRSMGINAVRTSHNMPAEELMELADEMGFLILSEGFDMWEKPKTKYDYARFFGDWVEKDVASWIRRDRNHPSIIGWSIGNEIYDTHESLRGLEITKMLYSLVRKHDFMKNAYVTIGSNYMQWENAQKCADFLGLAGYNYGERLYKEHHEKHPQRMIYGSETSSVVHSRGIYHFPLSMQVLTNDDEQCSSLGNCTTGWAAKNTEACIIDDRDAEFCAGQFIWTGFDYIGEPTPYQTKNSYFGQIDTAGFVKDSYYIFKGEWTDYKTDPFVHIFPYWSFNEGEIIDVRVCSNAPEVELFKDGVSQGRFAIDHKKGIDLIADYSLEFSKGTLEAVAYDENGQVIARDVKKSFGDSVKLMAKADKDCIKANGEEITRVEIWAVDQEGVPVENANNRVFVQVEGQGRLMGLDNGDSTDYDQYKTSDRRMFSGKLMAYIGSLTEAGEITVSLSSKGLEPCQVKITACESPVRKGVSCIERIPENDMKNKDDIPVRTVSLSAGSKLLTPDAPTTEIEYTALPENNNGGDIDFKVVTFRNIKSPIADCTVENGKVMVTAKGNGQFKLRALCKNHDKRYHVISELTMTSEGFDTTYVEPYSFVLGGLYSDSSERVSNGIERGAKFGGGHAYIGFANVDFGEFGSDTVTVQIFANTNDPVNVYFYDGNPDKGGELLGKYTYDLSPIWLTYQPMTYTLPKRLKGVHDFYIGSDFCYDIKGFEFEKQSKEFSVLYANQADDIYGDAYKVEEEAVTGILNNVCVEFGEVDYSEETPASVTICGKTPLEVNSVHVQLKGEEEHRILCDFKNSSDFSQQTFDVNIPKGKYQLSVTFLPGTEFDLKWIRFNKD